MMGPPLDISMDFIGGGLVDLVVGAAAAMLLFGFEWWVPPVLLAAWIATHWLLRESGVWRDRNTDEVRSAQRHADYSYRLAVEASPAKEVRFFGLAGWVTDRFVTTRRRLYDLQFEATRLREKSVISCLLIVVGRQPRRVLADRRPRRRWCDQHRADRRVHPGRHRCVVDRLRGVELGARRRERTGCSSGPRRGSRRHVGALQPGRLDLSTGPKEIRFHDVHFAYPVADDPAGGRPVLDGIDLVVPAGTSLAIVGQNGAGKTTLAKLLCRLYDPTSGRIEVDGVALTDLDPVAWRSHVTAVFQDFVRFELSVRTNVAPTGAPDDVIRAALVDAGAQDLAGGNLDTILSKGYPGGTDLSGGQWQRIALARALCAVRQGAGVVLLDEPTAQLDVRGEAEIFERVLRRDTTMHHRAHLPPLLDGAAGRPHLRHRGRASRRGRIAR